MESDYATFYFYSFYSKTSEDPIVIFLDEPYVKSLLSTTLLFLIIGWRIISAFCYSVN